jgi:predicted dehydrogenase
MRHFVDCFAEGRPPSETFDDGLVVNRIIDACYASMRSGVWVKLGAES